LDTVLGWDGCIVSVNDVPFELKLPFATLGEKAELEGDASDIVSGWDKETTSVWNSWGTSWG
jgi:hypothetical protein